MSISIMRSLNHGYCIINVTLERKYLRDFLRVNSTKISNSLLKVIKILRLFYDLFYLFKIRVKNIRLLIKKRRNIKENHSKK
jgi:hypothetical protein